MLEVIKLVCNPFEENTYLVIHTLSKECIIIDPGFFTASEQIQFNKIISEKKLKPSLLLLTHAHIDHVLGLDFVVNTYQLIPHLHKAEKIILDNLEITGKKYDVPTMAYTKGINFIDETSKLNWNEIDIQIFFTPGHSPGSLSFLMNKEILFAGDVLFYESYGRTDLFMGDFEQLKNSIQQKIFSLPEHIKIYSGHFQSTTIAHEKKYNPILF